jgi:hypothetical protein
LSDRENQAVNEKVKEFHDEKEVKTVEKNVTVEKIEAIETKKEEVEESKINKETVGGVNEVEIEPETKKEESNPELHETQTEELHKAEIEEISEPENNAEEEVQSVATDMKEGKEVDLEEEDVPASHNARLGDRFSKERSINDLINVENTKLEHKLSNRPVTSIQSAIGINDRFQYIRELFDGKPEIFINTITELDAKKDIKEAVAYLQQNFKWKKNETSLKFVNLVKRRFSHE